MKTSFLFIFFSFGLFAKAEIYRQMYISSKSIQYAGAACVFRLSNVDSRYAIEWNYSITTPDWINTDLNSSEPLPQEAARDCRESVCTVKAAYFQKNIPHYFAARQFIDDNKNGKHDDGEFVREWTPTTLVSTGSDYAHSCTFEL